MFQPQERWVRVTDDERNIRFVGINRPVTHMEAAQRLLQDDPQADLKLALLARDPRANAVAYIENPVGELDVDITIDEGMDTPTVAAEQFEMLTKVIPFAANLPVQWLKVLIAASALRDKDKLLEMIDQPPPPEQVQKQEVSERLALEGTVAGIEKTRSETARNLARAQGDTAQLGSLMMSAQAAARAPLVRPQISG